MKAQQSMTPDKPFFVYYATGATHAPHHVPKEWADKYKGQFDKGWDQVRVETLERQKKMGIVPAKPNWAHGRKTWPPGTRCRPISATVRAPGRSVCRLPEQTMPRSGVSGNPLADIDEFDDTLFIYIAGDNGFEGEGGFVGMYNEIRTSMASLKSSKN